MSNVYWNPQQGRYINNGYVSRDVVWGYQSFNNTNLPQNYDRDWGNYNFQGMNAPQNSVHNPNNVNSIYNNAEYGSHYPIHNTNMAPVKKGRSRRRYYRKK